MKSILITIYLVPIRRIVAPSTKEDLVEVLSYTTLSLVISTLGKDPNALYEDLEEDSKEEVNPNALREDLEGDPKEELTSPNPNSTPTTTTPTVTTLTITTSTIKPAIARKTTIKTLRKASIKKSLLVLLRRTKAKLRAL